MNGIAYEDGLGILLSWYWTFFGVKICRPWETYEELEETREKGEEGLRLENSHKTIDSAFRDLELKYENKP
jgi:hypothetical protein